MTHEVLGGEAMCRRSSACRLLRPGVSGRDCHLYDSHMAVIAAPPKGQVQHAQVAAHCATGACRSRGQRAPWGAGAPRSVGWSSRGAVQGARSGGLGRGRVLLY
jgi:hypothetical protein